MKILLINSVCGIGSTGRICTDISELLDLRRDECQIGYGRGKVPVKYKNRAIRIGNNIDVIFHTLISRIFDNTGHCSRKATKKFIKWIEEYNPDVIHLHNLHGYYVNLEILFDYLKKVQKPVVWTLHDCWAFTGHCSHFDNLGCFKWKEQGCIGCPQKKSYPSSLIFSRASKNYIEKREKFTGLQNLTIVTPSQWLAELVKKSFLNEYPIKVINNGIDLSVFKYTRNSFREKYGIQDKIIFLGMATSWGEMKGLSDFIKMNEIKLENEVFVLVGVTEQQASDLPKDMMGILRTNSTTELAEIYSAANVFINPTKQEVFGLVNIEAQACGTPVVSYRTGGCSEVVPQEYLIEKGDYEKLLWKAREVARLENPILVKASNFLKEDRYMEYITLYENICKEDMHTYSLR